MNCYRDIVIITFHDTELSLGDHTAGVLQGWMDDAREHAEDYYGKPRVIVSGWEGHLGYDNKGRMGIHMTLDSDVSEFIAILVIGIATRNLGESAFAVERTKPIKAYKKMEK